MSAKYRANNPVPKAISEPESSANNAQPARKDPRMTTATKTRAKRDTLTGKATFEDEPLTPGTPEFDAYVAGDDPVAAPEGSAERVGGEEKHSSDYSESAQASVTCPDDSCRARGECDHITVTDYNAGGEAVDREVSTSADNIGGVSTPTPELFTSLRPPEMWDGKEVIAHSLKLSGAVTVNRVANDDVEFWSGLHIGKRVYLNIAGDVGGSHYKPDKDGDAFTFVREVKIDSWSIGKDASDLEELTTALQDAQEERDHYGREYGRAVQALNTLVDGIARFHGATKDEDSDVPWGDLDTLAELAKDMKAEFDVVLPDWAAPLGEETSELTEQSAELAEEPSELSPLSESLAEALAPDPDDLPFD